jgi:hypothetical protein
MKKSLLASILLYSVVYAGNSIILPADSDYNSKGIRDRWSAEPLQVINSSSRPTQTPTDKEYTHSNNRLEQDNLGNPGNPIYNNYRECKASILINSNEAYNRGFEIGRAVTDFNIGRILVNISDQLNILFPIKKLMVESILEPPLISENSNNSVHENGQIYVSYEKKYSIIRKERFINKDSIKTWDKILLSHELDYYTMQSNPKKDSYNITLNLSTDEACNRVIRENADKQFKLGFIEGGKEISELYLSRLSQLEKYINSLYLYNRLYIEKKIDPPLIGEIDTSVSANENSLTINENFMKILKNAKFNEEVKKWRTYVIDHAQLKEIIKY